MAFIIEGFRADLSQLLEELLEEVSEKTIKIQFQVSKINVGDTRYEKIMLKELLTGHERSR